MAAPEPRPAAPASAPTPPLLEQILDAGPAATWSARALSGPTVGECVDARHPTLVGRARVRCTFGTESHEQWLPALQGLTIRVGDRVLLLQPGNWPEPLIVGVIDGFAVRPAVEHRAGPSVTLQRDEALQVVGPAGNRLVEIVQAEAGPMVRLLSPDVQLDMPGALTLRADRIHLEARAGEVRVKASDDVVVQGEVIHLN